MIHLALTLIHNKSELENEEQIVTLSTLLQEQFVTVTDEEGNEEQVFSHYTLSGLALPHEVKIYQIVPFQPDNKSEPYEAIKPANLSLLHSHNVYYGKGDEDMVGDHPRFFNWGLKRGTDYGAEAVVYLEDPQKLDFEALAASLNSLVDPDDKYEYVEDEACKVTSANLLKEIGQLNESLPSTEALTDLKQRISLEGKQYG